MKCLFTFFVLTVLLLSCKSGPDLSGGKKIYMTYCLQCHGEDGKLGLNDSKDLTKSTLEFDEAVSMVTNGKGLMTPYKGILSREDIETVVHYVISMRE